MEKTVEELQEVKFPECVEHCRLVKILGIGECENVSSCHGKFGDKKNCPVV